MLHQAPTTNLYLGKKPLQQKQSKLNYLFNQIEVLNELLIKVNIIIIII